MTTGWWRSSGLTTAIRPAGDGAAGETRGGSIDEPSTIVAGRAAES
jgi:hypothetical protein